MKGNKRAAITMSAEYVAERLGLKDGVKILTVQPNPWVDSIDFLLECDNFDIVPEGGFPPHVEPESVFKETKLYTKIITVGMTYGEAIKAATLGDEGTKITRSIWSGYWTYEKLEGLSKPILVATLKDTGDRVPATPYMEDQLAHDWMIVETDDDMAIGKSEKDILNYIFDHHTVSQHEILRDVYKKNDWPSAEFDAISTITKWLADKELILILPVAECQMPAFRISLRGINFINKERYGNELRK